MPDEKATSSAQTAKTHPFVLPDNADIIEAIQSAEKIEDHELYRIFLDQERAHPSLGWGLLGQVFNFLFKPGDTAAPFSPMAIFGDKRSMIPEDLTEEQLDALQTTLDIEDPEFRARVADVIWIRRRDASSARIAVDAYLASGARLEDPDHWVPSMERYERAARLARQVDRKGDLSLKVLAHLEARVRHYEGKDPLYFSLKAMELLEEFRYGDFSALAEIAGRIAEGSIKAGDYSRARSYFSVQSRLLRRSKQLERAETALVRHAESFVLEAEMHEANRSYMTAHHFWQEAVLAFRERRSLRDQVPELQRRIAEAGKRTLTEMKTASSGHFDISKEVAAVQTHFQSLPWDDAFYELALLLPLLDPDKLRDQTLESLRKSTIKGLFKAEIFDSAGRKIAVRPPLGTGDPRQEEAAIEGFMDEAARIHRHVHVHAALAPAVRVIRSEHEIDSAAIEKLIKDSEFIPEGRLSLFTKGIAAGLQFDFSTALHILVPQAENGLRHLLESQGIIPRNIDQDGVEEAWGIERVLSNDKMQEVLGADFVYELRTLLAGRLGPNLRNLIAHGLADEATLNGEMGFYLWWVLLRLTALPTAGMAAFTERKRGV